jgi:hypothetical protein
MTKHLKGLKDFFKDSCSMTFFWVNFHHFVENIWKIKYFITHSLCSEKNFAQKQFLFKTPKNCHNYLKHERVA